jgi:ABC-type branched-subunit amino acid transport system ATPase component
VTPAADASSVPGPIPPPGPGAADGTLRAEGITKSFGGVHALAGCSLTARAGGITGLIGPNGSGKTTLFNVMTGYERPDAGQVYLGERRITGAQPQRVFAYGIGRTFQLTRIFPRLTVLENMLVPAQRGRPTRRHREHAMDLLAFTGIVGHASALAGTLSYGQRKLLELAYVLVAEPSVVLLDEPAGGVNPSLVRHISERIRELNKAGRTFLIVEHNMDFVMNLCHQVTVLDSGSVVASGSPTAIRADPRVLDAYLGVGDDDDS